MKKAAPILIALALAVLIGAALFFLSAPEEGTGVDGESHPLYDALEASLNARVAMLAEIARQSCECVDQRGAPGDYSTVRCLEDSEIPEEMVGDYNACLVNMLRQQGPPPPQMETLIACNEAGIAELRSCLNEATTQRDCSMEQLDALMNCQRQVFAEDCSEQVGDELVQWLEAKGALSACAEILEGSFGLPELSSDAEAPQLTTISVTTEAIKVDDQVVVPLDRGVLTAEDVTTPDLQIPALGRAFGEHELSWALRIDAQALVPYRTLVAVMITATEVTGRPLLWNLRPLPRSRFALAPARRDGDRPDQQAPDLALSLTVAPDGFYLSVQGEILPARDECPSSGPTLCLIDEVDVLGAVDAAHQALADEDPAAAAIAFDRALGAYDWRRLYNFLSELEREHPGASTVYLSADLDLPSGLLRQVQEVAAVRLEEERYEEDQQFFNHRQQRRFGPPLFADLLFRVIQ